MSERERSRQRSGWLRWVAIAGIVWAVLLLGVSAVAEPTPENLTYAVSILGSGLLTFVLYTTRSIWLDRLATHPLRTAGLLGIASAAVVETLFLIAQQTFGARDIAAHPNLVVDLLLTMPWYAAMVITFVRVQHRRRFGTPAVLLLGAVYETGADGVVGGWLLPAFTGGPVPDLVSWLAGMAGFAFWPFILVYSPMLLPPAWLVATVRPPPPPPGPTWLDAARPLAWLVPFTVYLVVAIALLAQLGS